MLWLFFDRLTSALRKIFGMGLYTCTSPACTSPASTTSTWSASDHTAAPTQCSYLQPPASLHRWWLVRPTEAVLASPHSTATQFASELCLERSSATQQAPLLSPRPLCGLNNTMCLKEGLRIPYIPLPAGQGRPCLRPR